MTTKKLHKSELDPYQITLTNDTSKDIVVLDIRYPMIPYKILTNSEPVSCGTWLEGTRKFVTVQDEEELLNVFDIHSKDVLSACPSKKIALDGMPSSIVSTETEHAHYLGLCQENQFSLMNLKGRI